ncbi:MAG: hypothetical protein JJ971_00745 [Balneolaceae bacterium]|nr:hypothetical protein [Balneolaceae bacterium]MBO6544897.1 hypothetical protein [Balneolaceae bacterium]MBO6646293.1 hypothetical protein [Balneolaceae bacterium]
MNSKDLDLPKKEFKELLDISTEMILQKFEHFEERKAFHSFPQTEIENWFDEKPPSEGMSQVELLEEVKHKILDTATDNIGVHMYGYVMAGGTQISIIAEKLAATINQNIGKWHLAPSIVEIEKRVVQWSSEIIDFGKDIGGVLVSGGSEANLAGLTVARNIFFEKKNIQQKGLFGLKPFTVYASTEVHGCIDKSVTQLGIGTNNLRKIAVNSDFTIDIEILEQTIKEDIEKGFEPFCVIGTAGTVNTGAIDDLNSISALAQKYGLWFHVDGAYGGLACVLPSVKKYYMGLKKADSVAIDFHKWLYQTFEVGCVLVKNWDTLRNAYFKKADYLDSNLEDQNRLNFNEHTFQLSRNAKALKVWMSIKGYGMNKLKKMIQKDIDLAGYLSDQVNEAPDFELQARSALAVSCFRYVGNLSDESEIESFNKKLVAALEKDGRVFLTGTKLNGIFVLRACVINHRKQKKDIDYLLRIIRDVAKTLH